MNPLIFILFVYAVQLYRCEWRLEWNDEFDGNELDRTKWWITNGKDKLEAAEGEEVLSYSRENSKNIQIIDGVLAITAFQENYQGKSFTTATVNSKKAFLYGRLDMRAALPKGIHLKTEILLLPEKSDYGFDRVNGEIEIVAYLQNNYYFSRASYIEDFGSERSYPALEGFQEYSLEWNETLIIWSMNGSIRRTFDLDRIIHEYYERKGQPFHRKFYLAMRLQVFNFIQDKIVMSDKFYENWKCPSLLIDYVRLYQRDNSTNITQELETTLKNSNKTKENICEKINSKLNLIYAQANTNSKLIWQIGVPVFVLVILISIKALIYILIKRKRRLAEQGEEVYAEYGECEDTNKENEYSVIYSCPGNSYVINEDQAGLDTQDNYCDMSKQVQIKP